MTTPLTIPRWRWEPARGEVNLGNLFALIPDDVVLAVSSRDLDLADAETCLMGWTLREELARAANTSADSLESADELLTVSQNLETLYGGAWEDWNAVYQGVVDERRNTIELAWINRIEEALETSEKPQIVYNTSNRRIVLPANLYDALELSALAFGGIGGGLYVDVVEGFSVLAPVCAVGHFGFGVASGVETLTDKGDEPPYDFDSEDLLRKAGIDEIKNDRAVAAINARKGTPAFARVTFEEWVGELNVVRGGQ